MDLVSAYNIMIDPEQSEQTKESYVQVESVTTIRNGEEQVLLKPMKIDFPQGKPRQSLHVVRTLASFNA